jgi:hypothetical protein
MPGKRVLGASLLLLQHTFSSVLAMPMQAGRHGGRAGLRAAARETAAGVHMASSWPSNERCRRARAQGSQGEPVNGRTGTTCRLWSRHSDCREHSAVPLPVSTFNTGHRQQAGLKLPFRQPRLVCGSRLRFQNCPLRPSTPGSAAVRGRHTPHSALPRLEPCVLDHPHGEGGAQGFQPPPPGSYRGVL